MWGGWAVVYGVVFSAAGGLFHAYYLAVMAPALCALAGIGAVALWRSHGLARLLLPAVILVTALWQAHILGGYLGGLVALGPILLPAVLVGGAAFAAIILAARRGPLLAVAGSALILLLAMPAAWSVGTATMRFTTGFPAAQPPFLSDEAAIRRSRFAMIAGRIAGDPKLIAFLSEQRHDEQFLLAAVNARLAAPIIIATGDPVMALGGFAGRDPILDVDAFSRLVADNRVRFRADRRGQRWAAPDLRRRPSEGAGRLDPRQWQAGQPGAVALRRARCRPPALGRSFRHRTLRSGPGERRRRLTARLPRPGRADMMPPG
jgi:4-amino-4-deoxy-L-arabinose transferase-like glycosyltransferase